MENCRNTRIKKIQNNVTKLRNISFKSLDLSKQNCFIECEDITDPHFVRLKSKFLVQQKKLLFLKQKHSLLVKKSKDSRFLKNITSSLVRQKNSAQSAEIVSIIKAQYEFDKLFSKCLSIADLPKTLLGLKIFKNYQTCQVLIHEKGKMVADDLCSKRTHNTTSKTIPVANYNKIYNLIKKSKSKLFNQSNILNHSLGVVGSFLAKEIALKKHSLIILVSRNDLFPASQEEQIHFYKIMNFLEPIIHDLLEQYISHQRHNLLSLCLHALPLPIQIAKFDQNIFTNFLGKEHFNNEAAYNTALTYKLSDNATLFLNNPMSKQEIEDIHHFLRISLLGELLNTLQHELNNPLFGLKLTADLICEESPNQESRETVIALASNCVRCQNIINNFSKLYTTNENFETINLASTLSEIFVLTKSETRGISKEIRFQSSIDPSQINLHTNPTWLTQIIFNFIINGAQSIKSTLDQSVSPHILVMVDTISAPDQLKISVIDTGEGIPNDMIPKIMEPFVTSKPMGTGLGLAICNYLAKKMNGSISFKNNTPLPGATFTIELPGTSVVL